MADEPVMPAERIWIEADDECPYFYEAHELHDVEQDVIEYVRADLYAALEAQLAEAREALAESDRHAEKLEALLDPHIAWEGKPAKAYAELTEALQKAEADAARMREALREAAAALDQAREDVACWGSYAGEYFQDKHDLEGDLDRLAKQASAARRALEGGE